MPRAKARCQVCSLDKRKNNKPLYPTHNPPLPAYPTMPLVVSGVTHNPGNGRHPPHSDPHDGDGDDDDMTNHSTIQQRSQPDELTSATEGRPKTNMRRLECIGGDTKRRRCRMPTKPRGHIRDEDSNHLQEQKSERKPFRGNGAWGLAGGAPDLRCPRVAPPV